jgi:hypothetical protein
VLVAELSQAAFLNEAGKIIGCPAGACTVVSMVETKTVGEVQCCHSGVAVFWVAQKTESSTEHYPSWNVSHSWPAFVAATHLPAISGNE